MNNDDYFKSFENQNKVNDEHLIIKTIRYILNDIFPAPNNPWGIFFYCSILILLKMIFSYSLNWYAENYGDQFDDDLKAMPIEISEKILERRKLKTKQAIEILKRIN